MHTFRRQSMIGLISWFRESETPLQSLIPRNPKIAFSRIQFWAHKRGLESLFSLSMRLIYVKIGRKLADNLNLKPFLRIFDFALVFDIWPFLSKISQKLPCWSSKIYTKKKKQNKKRFNRNPRHPFWFWFNVCILSSTENDKSRLSVCK